VVDGPGADSPLGWSWGVEVKCARFGFQGDRQFYADVSSIMEHSLSTIVSPSVFRLGSDGRECWFFSSFEFTDATYSRSNIVFCPFDAMQDKKVTIGDPFGAKQFSSTEEAIRQLKLEYLGEVKRDGKTCCHVRSWAGKIMLNSAYGIQDWLIDAQSLLPAVCQTTYFRYEFSYARINEPIAKEMFQIPTIPGVQRKPYKLEEGYDHFHLHASDGSDGRISARWGQEGQKGSLSDGLN
jgi:hypothetical protein